MSKPSFRQCLLAAFCRALLVPVIALVCIPFHMAFTLLAAVLLPFEGAGYLGLGLSLLLTTAWALTVKPWHVRAWKFANAMTNGTVTSLLGEHYRSATQARVAAGKLDAAQADALLTPPTYTRARHAQGESARRQGWQSDAGSGHSSGSSTNPANGLPMVGGVGGVDVMGNSWGTDSSWQSGSDSFGSSGSGFSDN
jgi:hypothetical protein